MSKSEVISVYNGKPLFDAACASFCMGKPMTLMITIHFGRALLEMDSVHGFIESFFHLANDWMRYRAGHSSYHIWVLENPPGKGLHMHFLIHVPRDLRSAFLLAQRRWVKLAGGKQRRGYLKSVPLYSLDGDFYAFLRRGLIGATRYLLKGADPVLCEAILKEHEPQGTIIGKRSGISQSLSPARLALHSKCENDLGTPCLQQRSFFVLQQAVRSLPWRDDSHTGFIDLRRPRRVPDRLFRGRAPSPEETVGGSRW